MYEWQNLWWSAYSGLAVCLWPSLYRSPPCQIDMTLAERQSNAFSSVEVSDYKKSDLTAKHSHCLFISSWILLTQTTLEYPDTILRPLCPCNLQYLWWFYCSISSATAGSPTTTHRNATSSSLSDFSEKAERDQVCLSFFSSMFFFAVPQSQSPPGAVVITPVTLSLLRAHAQGQSCAEVNLWVCIHELVPGDGAGKPHSER